VNSLDARREADEAYDDYYDAAKKDGEPLIQGRHGGVIVNQPRAVGTYFLSGVQHPNRRIEQRRQDEQDWLDAIDQRQNGRRFDDREHGDGTSFADRNPTLSPVFARIFEAHGL